MTRSTGRSVCQSMVSQALQTRETMPDDGRCADFGPGRAAAGRGLTMGRIDAMWLVSTEQTGRRHRGLGAGHRVPGTVDWCTGPR